MDALDRGTDALRAAVEAAAAEASTGRWPDPHSQIGTHHLLLGILLQRETEAARLLEAHGVTVDAFHERGDWLLRPGHREPNKQGQGPAVIHAPVVGSVVPVLAPGTTVEPPGALTPRAATALAEASRLTDGPVDTVHLLAALLASDQSFGTGIVTMASATPLAQFRQLVDDLL